MKTSEVLQKAIEALNERKWCKGTLVSALDGSCCALGAISVAREIKEYNDYYKTDIYRWPDDEDPAVAALIKAGDLQPQSPDDASDSAAIVYGWNDHEDTTRNDVLEVFEKALEEARKDDN